MSNYHDDHVEDMEDDYDMDDPAEDMVDAHHERGLRDSDSEDEEYAHSVCSSLVILYCCVAAIGIKSYVYKFISCWVIRSLNVFPLMLELEV